MSQKSPAKGISYNYTYVLWEPYEPPKYILHRWEPPSAEDLKRDAANKYPGLDAYFRNYIPVDKR